MGTLHSNGSLGLRWALGGVQCSAFGNYVMSSGEVEFTGDEMTVKDANGNDLIWYGYNTRRETTLEYVVTGTAANVSASVTMPAFGTMITVTDTTGGNPLTGSNYIVKLATLKEAASDAAKVVVKATAYDGITA